MCDRCFLLPDADAEPNAVVFAAIIIPLVFASLAILTFVCCRKYVHSSPSFFLKIICLFPIGCGVLFILFYSNFVELSLFRNKDHIFPKVPQPRDFLSDIYDNNNKVTLLLPDRLIS